MNDDVADTTIRSSKTTIVIFVGMASVIGLPGIYWLWSGYSRGLIVLPFGFLMFLPALRYRISWNATTLWYRSVLFEHSVKLREIHKFDMAGGATGGPFDPTIGLRLFARSAGKPIMVINLKPFARDDIVKLFRMLNNGH